MGSGALYAIIDGMTEMHKWCVDNWDMLEVNFRLERVFIHYSIFFTSPPASVSLRSYPVLSKLPYHLDYVNCRGDEKLLSECRHYELSIHRCNSESRVLCSGKLFFNSVRKVL